MIEACIIRNKGQLQIAIGQQCRHRKLWRELWDNRRKNSSGRWYRPCASCERQQISGRLLAGFISKFAKVNEAEKQKKAENPDKSRLSAWFLASPARFERAAFRLGEPLNICHLCSPMYRKVAIRQAFFVFRVAPCSSKFTGVVRCSPVHFSSFLDFSKKGNKNIFHLPPILALFRAKTHLQSNRESKQNI